MSKKARRGDKFQPPSWVHHVQLDNCALKVKKDNKQIQLINQIARRSYLLIGRNATMSHIKLDHPSISRRHAMFGHGKSGNLYVMDLGSSHGTYVNENRLQSNKREVLHDGDVVRFGASTRHYCVKLDLDEGTPSPPRNTSSSDDQSRRRKRRNEDTDDGEPTRKKIRTEGDSEFVEEPSASRDPAGDAAVTNGDTTAQDQKEEEVPAGPSVENQSSATSGATSIRARHILVKHAQSRRPSSWRETNVTRSKEAAMSEIAQIRENLLNCSSDELEREFAEIAAKKSDCKSAKRGGDLGDLSSGRMQQRFQEAACALSVLQLSQPVDTDSGIHLILRTG